MLSREEFVGVGGAWVQVVLGDFLRLGGAFVQVVPRMYQG